jgi:HSP20 family protein
MSPAQYYQQPGTQQSWIQQPLAQTPSWMQASVQPLTQSSQPLSGAEHLMPAGGAVGQQAPGGIQQTPMGQTQQSLAGATATETAGMSQRIGVGVGQEQATQAGAGTAEIPLIDMFEADDEFVLLADLPGYDGDEIDLEASDQTLRITAVRQDAPEEELRPVQRERGDRAERVVQLPGLFEVNDAKAVCKNGVCRITLPKAGGAGSRRIGVQ